MWTRGDCSCYLLWESWIYLIDAAALKLAIYELSSPAAELGLTKALFLGTGIDEKLIGPPLRGLWGTETSFLLI